MIIMILISYRFISIIDDDNLILVALFKVIVDIWYDILDFPDGTSTILQKKVGWCTNDRPKIGFLEDQTTIDGQIFWEQTTQVKTLQTPKVRHNQSVKNITIYGYKLYVSNVNTTVYVYGYILLYYTEYNMIIIVYNTVYM